MIRTGQSIPPIDDALDTPDHQIDEVLVLLDEAIIAARWMFDMHPYPAEVEHMYEHLKDALHGVSGELAKMRAVPAQLTATTASDG